MSELSKKPLMYIVPSYVASLRYFEKLLPIIKEQYEPVFVLIGGSSMKAYCEENGLAYKEVWVRSVQGTVSFSNLPLIAPIRDRLGFAAAWRNFLATEEKPAVILSAPPRIFYLQYMAATARSSGIPVYALQWSMMALENKQSHKYKRLLREPRQYPLLLKFLALSVHGWLLSIILQLADLVRLGPGFTYPWWNVDKLGVIDHNGLNAFSVLKGDPGEMVIVGSIETDAAAQQMSDIKASAGARLSLQQKYHLDPEKRVITVISMTFHLFSPTYVTDDAGQRRYFKEIFKTIRSVYPAETHEIVFKMHPRETNIYATEATEYAITLVGREGVMEEIVALSDLVVTHPLTSANYVVTAADAPTIVVNFSSLDFLDACGKHYGMRNIIKDISSFTANLEAAKAGTLMSQYDTEKIITGVTENVRAFIRV